MGCIKFAMPLLSTLAALVIIVHSEENYEQDYRELRPKTVNVDTPYLEQPWRNMQEVPIMTQSPLIAQGDVWDESNPDPPLRRRRPGRKRKRRPIVSQEDDLITQERYINPDTSRPRRQENIDTPRRRRKKIFEDSREGSRWTDEETEHRRRRGQKRKRLQTDTWPELSEFNDYRNYERQKSQEGIDNTETRIDNTYYNDHNTNNDEEKKGEAEFDNHGHETELIDITTVGVIENENEEQDTVQINDDISLSEFSSETLDPSVKFNRSQIVPREKNKKYISNYKDEYVAKAKSKQILIDCKLGLSKSVGIEKSLEKIKILSKRSTKYEPSIIPFEEQLPLNPQTLKLILKRSNGKSLSEILQQNNLTLTDLLRGKEKALTILQNEEIESNQESNPNKISDYTFTTRTLDHINKQVANKNEYELNVPESIDTETTTVIDTTIAIEQSQKTTITRRGESVLREQLEVTSEGPKITKNYIRRRFPTGVRRKIRMRLMANNTYKGQLSRDLIAQSSMKYKNNRNVSRPRDWKEFMPSRVKIGQIKTHPTTEYESHLENITTTTYTPQESTTQEIFETTTDPSNLHENTEMPILNEIDIETLNTSEPYTTTESIHTTTEAFEELVTENIVISEKSTISSIKPIINASDLRRQVFNNRLRRKRLRHKVSSTESPDNVSLQQVFGESNFVSASEFITRSQTKTTNANEDDEFSTLEDFFTTESSQNVRKRHRTKMLTSSSNNIPLTTPSTITTEEIAKIEIEEILKDSITLEKLTKILKERNMTLNELVAHRERGSSHLHLADIFHNASREPNPPEPFLTKSLIEPISKETYPLRALLEANLHDAKTTTIDPNTPSNLNIPVVMNFGNNVNEIGENMGIIALFKNFSKFENNSINEDDNIGTLISNSKVEIINTTRDGRSFPDDNDSVTWNNLITAIQRNHRTNDDDDKTFTTDITIPKTLQKTNTEDGTDDDDGLIIFEDLQRLKNIDNKIDPDELLEYNLYERNESPLTPGVTASPASNTKSVTVATLSIIGLALILFLLTYAALKWKQQSIMLHKKHSTEDVCVPSPIFENRKTQKLNSSSRSMSPMLTTNIYAIDSQETRDGNESPEYMWDTLRKPYQ